MLLLGDRPLGFEVLAHVSAPASNVAFGRQYVGHISETEGRRAGRRNIEPRNHDYVQESGRHGAVAKEKAVHDVGPKIYNGSNEVFVHFKRGQGERQGIGYAYPFPVRGVGLGNPMVPRNPALRGIGPGSKAVRPNTKIYELANKRKMICFLGDQITWAFKGSRAKTERMRK